MKNFYILVNKNNMLLINCRVLFDFINQNSNSLEEKDVFEKVLRESIHILKIEDEYSKNSEFRMKLSTFISKIRAKWKKASRYLPRFLEHNNTWLNENKDFSRIVFEFPRS